jgi:hypothetical protein
VEEADLQWDPELVARCEAGKRMRVQLGGRLAAAWGPLVALDVEVERVTDGREPWPHRGADERRLEGHCYHLVSGAE